MEARLAVAVALAHDARQWPAFGTRMRRDASAKGRARVFCDVFCDVTPRTSRNRQELARVVECDRKRAQTRMNTG